ncbi:Cys-tRNA(Pro) deacylase [Allobaculum stercoricanis]|uniref:Cys-tRNA(Pro) deacylase n=1 Tax=Allobaculum stercoricanis TaxID=174709 RepID=UPI0029420456|nr:Cys-tRNA(Pro) deacylase [Allobaculum stercoricanis]
MKIKKTNAMRHLDTLKIPYSVHELKLGEAVDAITVANQLDASVDRVFKTLVTVSNDKEYFVFMIPAQAHLSLKKAAKIVGKKKVEMITQKQLLPLTGYVHGGCSPLGMKKQFPTYFDQSALNFETIYFSAGKIGVQIEMDPQYLDPSAKAKPADLCEE